MGYFFYFLGVTFFASISLKIFLFFKNKQKKHHQSFLKRQGGCILVLLFLMMISIYFFVFKNPLHLLEKDYWSIVIASFIICIGGIIDDRLNLKPIYQLCFQILVALVLIIAKDTINHISLPYLGIVYLPNIIKHLFTIFWIVLIINSFNWLDGIDGLAGGLGFIGSIIIFFLSLTTLVNQPATALIAITLAGVLLGFAFFNFPPAKIYLGSAGSGFVGLILAILSLYSGGKIATALLILGLPLLDFVYVIYLRVKNKKYPWQGGDRFHLHYQLQDNYHFKPIKILFLFYFISASMGLIALSLQTGLKFFALILFFLLFFLIRKMVSF